MTRESRVLPSRPEHIQSVKILAATLGRPSSSTCRIDWTSSCTVMFTPSSTSICSATRDIRYTHIFSAEKKYTRSDKKKEWDKIHISDKLNCEIFVLPNMLLHLIRLSMRCHWDLCSSGILHVVTRTSDPWRRDHYAVSKFWAIKTQWQRAISQNS